MAERRTQPSRREPPSAAPDTTVLSMIEGQIAILERNLSRRLDATERNVAGRFDRQDRELCEIKAQTMKTNGRVTGLEKARERAQGVMLAFRWVPAIVSIALSAGCTILVMALSGNIR